MIAKRLGAFVRAGQVPEVWAAVAAVFRDYGYRRLRHRARIKFLIADWGAEKFREVMEKEYLGYALADGPAPVNVDGGAARPRGRPPAAGRPVLRRLRAARRPARRRAARRDRHARRAATAAAGCGPPPSRRWSSSTCRTPSRRRPRGRARRARPAGEPERLPPAHDGLHRDRVLQARDRGDQGPGDDPDRRARAAAARLRRAGHDQRQRLPELLRPHPDRRHRPQGVAGDRRVTASRSRGSRSTSAAR